VEEDDGMTTEDPIIEIDWKEVLLKLELLAGMLTCKKIPFPNVLTRDHATTVLIFQLGYVNGRLQDREVEKTVLEVIDRYDKHFASEAEKDPRY
jgi:hypothetical protein